MSQISSFLRTWGRASALGAIYIVAAWLSGKLVYTDGAVTSVWLSVGVAIPILARMGLRFWPVILVAEICSAYCIYGRIPGLSELTAVG
ncbi:MAG: hypothetical protein J6386_00110 [Candidatus Synoicihabitans palmerolidicus]|nr:hypothetical protein [Candidatus Synoicihabitans palmerolidicus]